MNGSMMRVLLSRDSEILFFDVCFGIALILRIVCQIAMGSSCLKYGTHGLFHSGEYVWCCACSRGHRC